MAVSFGTKITSGPLAGCVKIVNWGDAWGAAIPIYACIVFSCAVLAAKLSLNGARVHGLALIALGLVVGTAIISAPHCASSEAALHVSYWSNWAMVAFAVAACAFTKIERGRALAPGGWAQSLVYKKVAPPMTSAFGRRDWGIFGPINEALTMTYGEAGVWCVILAWFAIAFEDKYDFAKNALGENAGRAIGKSFAQVAMRAYFLSVLSPTRNGVIYIVFGVPFERGVRLHKMAGRLMVLFSYLHVICMLAGGTESSTVKWSNALNMDAHNNWPGVVALFAWTMLLLSSLPFVRRHHFETFYWLHLNFWFVGNVFMVLHDRKNVVIWIVASIVPFWLDIGVRWYTKLAKKSKLVRYEIVSEDLVKLVLVRNEGLDWPGGAFDFHPGSYIWLSVDVPSDKRTESLMPKIEVPGGPPGGVPSWIWFHPITVSSFDDKTGELTVFIKRFGKGVEQWSGQLVATMKAVSESNLSVDDIRVHIGGPNGSLQVEPDAMDHCVLTAGGIGVTPMAAILEDRVRKVSSGAINGRTTLLWTTRSAEEIAAFSYLFDSISVLPQDQRALFDIRVFKTGQNVGEDIEAMANKLVKITSGRPDFGALIKKIAEQCDSTQRVGVYTCGPEALSDACEAAASANGCYIHRETFEF